VAAALTFVVVVGACVALVVSSDGGVSGAGIEPGSEVVMAVPGAGSRSWIVEKPYSSELMRVEAGRENPVWVSEPLEDSGLGPRLAVDDRRVYASDGRRVLALDLATGNEVWSVPMDDDVVPPSTACATCFELLGGRLVVATIDGEIHLLDEGSGDEVWSHRFVSTSGRALIAGGSIVLVDERDEGLPGTQLQTVDPEDGHEISRVAPECPPLRPNDAPALMSSDGPVSPVDGEAAVIVGIGSPPACRQRIDLSTGRTAWTAPPAEQSAIDADTVQHDGVRFTATYAGIDRLDLASGEERRLVAVEEYETLVPTTVVEDVLLLTSTNNRGSTTSKLVGIDLASGDRLWSHDMDRTLPPRPGESGITVGETSPTWLWATGGDGEVRVLTFTAGDGDGAEPTLTVAALDAGTGQRRSTSETPVEGVDTSYELNVLERRDDSLVLNVEGRLRVLDTRTGRVVAKWP
jgi:outer membrane protein assembly factor BamB